MMMGLMAKMTVVKEKRVFYLLLLCVFIVVAIVEKCCDVRDLT
jgi:hypothetical protein